MAARLSHHPDRLVGEGKGEEARDADDHRVAERSVGLPPQAVDGGYHGSEGQQAERSVVTPPEPTVDAVDQERVTAERELGHGPAEEIEVALAPEDEGGERQPGEEDGGEQEGLDPATGAQCGCDARRDSDSPQPETVEAQSIHQALPGMPRDAPNVQSPAMQSGAADALAVVHEHILACTDCPLHLRRTQAVPGTGPAGARIMAVGEGPGETEDRVGRPFVGAAGNVLTKLLESIGVRRDDIYITNVVKCRPPGNRDPEPAEMEACSHFLDAQIEIIRPDVILILGRHALARLLPGAGGISRLHGRKVVRGDRLYVPLYHPAAALYQASLMRTLEDDMLKVREYLEEADARRQPAHAAAPAPHGQASDPTTPSVPPPSEPPSRDQLSLF